MDGLTDSLKSFWNKIWKKYQVELFLISGSLIITIVSVVLYFKNIDDRQTSLNLVQQEKIIQSPALEIFVDIAGAVETPNVYQLKSGARLKDVLKLAGGLSTNADTSFFTRNYNLSRLVTDQEKIYIPSVDEVANGLFVENIRALDYTQPQLIQKEPQASESDSELINLNLASLEELDQLSGVGKVTAEKIIRNRPYGSVEELLTKKTINKSVFEKIKNLITVN